MSTSEMAVVIYFYGRTETYFVQVPEGAVPPYDNAELIKCLKALEFVDGVWRSFGKPRLNVTTFAGTQPSKSYVRTGVLDCLDRHGYKPARIAA